MTDSERQKMEWVKTLKPDTVVWEITLACNMRCIHCGSSASPLKERPDELTTEEAIRVIHEFKEIGVNRVVLSGGEPFMRSDWYILAAEVAKLGMVPSFITNGFMVTEEVADKIKSLNAPLAHVGVSVDGTEKVHDYIRQTKGSFQRATRALEIFRAKGVKASVITQVNKLNFKILPEIRDHIFKYGIYAWQIQLATPWGRLAKNPKLLLTPKDYVELVKFIAEQRRVYGDMVVGADDIGYYTELEPCIRPRAEWQGCYAGLRNLGLTSNGGVTGCLSLQAPKFIEGNVRKTPLREIWYDPNKFKYNRGFKEKNLRGFCKECIHRLKCRGGCKNTAEAFSGCLFENYYCVHRVAFDKKLSKFKIKPKIKASLAHYHP